ncbi:hypothetical protein AV530_008826 [Patagioenas fasciata monilis]|uniref:Uncharacterized protein n=1 Tax=Patagioenas fasciata monilis TaxID=372326 RepID=A0A1V4JTW0_PATFA|nr:hypothetical protein AV530_008826 [Patagioenas fasciata monilis]
MKVLKELTNSSTLTLVHLSGVLRRHLNIQAKFCVSGRLVLQDGVVREEPSCNEEPRMLQVLQLFPLYTRSCIVNSDRVIADSSYLPANLL